MPTIVDVSSLDRFTVFPTTFNTVTPTPSPLSIARPDEIPVTLSTSTDVEPVGASLVTFGDTTAPPVPVIAVTCVPGSIPLAVKGEPISGTSSSKGMKSLPRGTFKAVDIIPLLP